MGYESTVKTPWQLHMTTIIVAVDFSAITQTLVEKAAPIAKCIEARVCLIHIAAPDPDFVSFEAGPGHVRDWRAKDLKNEKHELERLADRLRGQGIEVMSLLIQNTTAEGLLSQVERLKPEMLILGTQGHGALSSLVGSTSKQVIKHAKCPILLIPHT